MAELANDTPVSMKGAVFEAFRRRERNGVLASAGVGLVTALVAIVGSFVLIYQGAFAEIAAWQNDLASAIIPADPAETPPAVMPSPPAALFALIPGALATMFLIYVAMAAFEAACLRWMLRGESDGLFFGLNLRADTWRVYLGYWVWFACAAGFYASQIFAIVVGFAAGGVTAVLGYPVASGLVGRITGIVVFLTAASALVWAAVRMAPAAATSIEKRRFAFFEAWGVSRGLFWPMLGSFLLAVLPYYLVVLAIEIAALIIAADSMRPAFEAPSDAPAPDLAAFPAKFMQPEILAALLMTGAILIALSFLFHLTMIGINARVIMVDRARRAAA